jgi:hypothetical protein
MPRNRGLHPALPGPGPGSIPGPRPAEPPLPLREPILAALGLDTGLADADLPPQARILLTAIDELGPALVAHILRPVR